jgi:hypothetical protein
MHKISQHTPKRASDLGHVPEQQFFRSPHTKVAPAGVLRFQSLPHVEALSLCLPGLKASAFLTTVSIRSVREAVAALVDGSGPVQFESVSAARRGLSRTDGFDGWVPPPPVLCLMYDQAETSVDLRFKEPKNREGWITMNRRRSSLSPPTQSIAIYTKVMFAASFVQVLKRYAYFRDQGDMASSTKQDMFSLGDRFAIEDGPLRNHCGGAAGRPMNMHI